MERVLASLIDAIPNNLLKSLILMTCLKPEIILAFLFGV